MEETPTAPTLLLDALEDDASPLEFDLPATSPDPDIDAEVEREHYDEQILAALVSP